METDDVAARLCETIGDGLCVFMRGEACSAVEIDSPEACLGAVLKLKMIARCVHEAVLARRALALEYKRDVDGHIVVKKGIRYEF